MQAGDSSAARQRQGAPIWSQAAERFPPADRILSTILTRQAAQYRDRTLFVFGETRWSYAETAAIAAASAARLMRAGIRAGDRVALMCSNRPEFLEVYLGCAWMGAVTVPINTALRGIQLSHILRNSTPKLLVIESGFMPAIETLERDVAPPDLVWMIGESAASSVAPGSISPLPALGEGASPAPVRPDDTVAILYTSGTTGPSKGVCCPQAQMFWWGVYSARALEHPRGRCAVHDAAAVPHQCAERVLSGAAERLHLRARAEILRLRFLGGGATASGNRRLSPRRDGRDAAGAAEIRRRHRAFPAGRARRRRPRPVSRPVSRTLRRAAARRLRLDRNEFRVRKLHPVRSPRHDGPSRRGRGGLHRGSRRRASP